MNEKQCFLIICLFLLIKAGLYSQNTSELWGKSGELWNPKGQLPDYSFAGYHAGEKKIPDNIPIVTNVKDFGAVGDGVTNDLIAFKKAIIATNNGALLIPKGRYLLDGYLNVAKSNIVIRGEGTGEDGTVLYFPKDLSTITGAADRSPWQYGNGGLLWVGKRYGNAVGKKIGDVTQDNVRGGTTLTVSSTDGLAPDMYIQLKMNDPSDHSLQFHLHNDMVSASDYTTIPGISFEWPVRIKSISGNKIELYQALRCDVKQKWSPAIYLCSFGAEEVGIENLRIETPDDVYRGHLYEVGYNGLGFICALNCWAKNIVFANVENAVDIAMSKHCTVKNIEIYGPTRGGATEADQGYFGHHGVSFRKTADNLLTDFYVFDKYNHEITITKTCNGNVVKRGIGYNMSMDHHKYAPYENLVSVINTGLGTKAFVSSGKEIYGPHSGARETFWNIRSEDWQKPTAPFWAIYQTNIIPSASTEKTNEKWCEDIDNLQPIDLYTSQLAHRLNTTEKSEGTMKPMIYPKPGIYCGDIEISIFKLFNDDIIYYTTDGSEPTKNSMKYDGNFTLDFTQGEISKYVKAKVFSKNGEETLVASTLYKQDTFAPVIQQIETSITTEFKVFFNEAIDSESAEDTYFFTLNNDIDIDKVVVNSMYHVTVFTKQPLENEQTYTLRVEGVKDLNGNAMEPTEEAFLYINNTVVASLDDGNIPLNTIDGNLNTRWSAQGEGQWIKYDLGSIKKVEYLEIAFYKGNERSTFFIIETSEDNQIWTPIFDGQSSGKTLDLEKFEIDDTEARFVRLVCFGNNSSNVTSILWNSITEVEISASDIPEISTNINAPDPDAVQAYPIPASDVLFFNVPTEYTLLNISLTNIFGDVIQFMYPVNSGTIDITKLSTGIYFMNIQTRQGVLCKKIVVD